MRENRTYGSVRGGASQLGMSSLYSTYRMGRIKKCCALRAIFKRGGGKMRIKQGQPLMTRTVTTFLKTIKLNKKFAELFKATPRRALGEPPEAIF